jgi:hypothetical protein
MTSRKVGAFLVGAAGIVAAFTGVAQWQNWNAFLGLHERLRRSAVAGRYALPAVVGAC